jgi:uncharacterized protein
MTFAWYGHLKYKSVPLVTVILVSWGIAFVEYCFAGKPDGQRGLFARRAQDHSGGEHLGGVRRPHRGLFQLAAQPDSRRGFALIALGALLVFRGQA